MLPLTAPHADAAMLRQHAMLSADERHALCHFAMIADAETLSQRLRRLLIFEPFHQMLLPLLTRHALMAADLAYEMLFRF